MSKYEVFSGPHFPAFRLNTERYEVSVFGHISHSEYSTSMSVLVVIEIKWSPRGSKKYEKKKTTTKKDLFGSS